VSQTTTQSSIRERYNAAQNFPKFGIFRSSILRKGSAWMILGPGLYWLGHEEHTFEEALEFVRDRIRQYRVAE